MYSVLTLPGGLNKKAGGGLGVESSENGENNGRNKKVRGSFKDPSRQDNIVELSHKNFAIQSKKKMRWAVNMYCEWRLNRLNGGEQEVPIEITRANLDSVFTFNKSDLSYALSCFIREVKKLNGDDCPPNTLTEIIIMIQMHLNETGIYWKLLDEPVFMGLHNVLDNTMKERTAQGLGVVVSSDVISLDQENVLFQKGQ